MRVTRENGNKTYVRDWPKNYLSNYFASYTRLPHPCIRVKLASLV